MTGNILIKPAGRKFATVTLMALFSLSIIFHVMVLSGVIPDDLVWGGHSRDQSTTLLLECISIALNALMLTVVLADAGSIRLPLRVKTIRILFTIMFVLFLLNTVGNLFSENKWEKVIFTPITLLLALCCLRLSMKDCLQNRTN